MIPAEHSLVNAQWVQDDATKQVFWACNCGSQPANKTLRFVAANRHLFNVWPPAADSNAPVPING